MPGERHGSGRFWIGLMAGALAGLALGKRLASAHDTPHLKVWQRVLARSRGQSGAALLAGHLSHHCANASSR